MDPKYFELGNIVLQSGITLQGAVLSYQTYGTLNADRTNVIIFNTSFAAQHHEFEWLIKDGRALDPSRYFIVIPDLFGNGLSTSPSNVSIPYTQGRFPVITMYDAVMQQRRLLTEVLDIRKVQLVAGYSMGGQQALHWGALFPNFVERVAAICCSARTSEHNIAFLESLRAALTADSAWRGGWFATTPVHGLRAVARAFAVWALSPAFYREAVYRDLGFESIDDFLINVWERSYLNRNADNLLAMMATWRHADISENPVYQGNLKSALAGISAKTFLMPCMTDCYFPPEDCQIQAESMPNAEVRPISSVWGHRAGYPNLCAEDAEFINSNLLELLER